MSRSDRPTIREGSPDDFARLSAMQRVTLDEYWPALLEAALDGPPLVLVLETDRPVGYGLVVPGDGTAYLAELAIAPVEQGRGYGTKLLDALLDRLRAEGFETVRLTARADDDWVRSFYTKFDFAVVDEVTNHYGQTGDDGNTDENATGDAVVMARDL